jgi:transposase
MTQALKTVAMESTGSYWIPLLEILEARGFEVQIQRIQKALTQMNLKLPQVLSDNQQLPKNCRRPNLPEFNIRQALYRLTGQLGFDLVAVEPVPE